MTYCAPQLFFKKKVNQHAAWFNSDFSHCGGWKIKAKLFGSKNLFFNQNTLGILIDPSLILKKNPKTHTKTWNQLEIKKILELRSLFSTLKKTHKLKLSHEII
jgi:hypothetical protein